MLYSHVGIHIKYNCIERVLRSVLDVKTRYDVKNSLVKINIQLISEVMKFDQSCPYFIA